MKEYDKVYEFIPSDIAKQYSSIELLLQYLRKSQNTAVDKVNSKPAERVCHLDKNMNFLDLGCGKGELRSQVPQLMKVSYFGLDIEKSPEVDARILSSPSFYTYDGIHIPFPDNYFDIIFSKQVFEHVRYPEQLLSDINRVLKHDGLFIGSVSYLEPYHSYSIFNFTPYGWITICQDAGLNCIVVRPGIDAITMITRSIIHKKNFPNSFWDESPQNSYFIHAAELTTRQKNNRMLQHCAQFCFVFKKNK